MKIIMEFDFENVKEKKLFSTIISLIREHNVKKVKHHFIYKLRGEKE